MAVIQYIEQARPGDLVTYGNKCHKIIFNGDPHIQFRENGKRVRKYLRNILFEYGSYQDYVFNEWWRRFPEYDQFKTFTDHEKLSS